MTDLKHLKHLSEVRSNTGIQFLTPAVYPGNHCPMRFASNIVESVEGLSSLLVGMPECTTYSRIFSPQPQGKHGELHWLYVLDANEVVLGCREGVIDALKKMDAAGAEAILIVATCIPELIGEDIEGIVHEVQPQLSARIAFTMLGQFKNVGHPSGSWKTMEAMVALMDTQERHPTCINVLGSSPGERREPKPSLLAELEERGFSLRHLGPGTSLADFRSAPDAALDLVISSNALPLAVKMEQAFGVPYIAMPALYDVADIDSAYSDLAQHLGFNWNGEFKEERQRALALQDQAKERFQGLRNVFAGRVDTPLSLAAYLGRLGMAPLLLHLEEYQPKDSGYAQELVDMGHDPWVCRMVNQEAEIPILESLHPDVCFGRIMGKGGQRGNGRGRGGEGGQGREGGPGGRGGQRGGGSSMTCVTPAGGNQVGYSRTADLLRNILEALERPGASMGRRMS